MWLRKLVVGCALALGASGCGAPAHAAVGDFLVEVDAPGAGLVVPNDETSIELEGRAKIVGGVRNLDLFLVLDTSKSLKESDPENHRATGAIGLVRSLSWTDARIGIVDFDKKARLVSPLTKDREATIAAIRTLDQDGSSDVMRGIATALRGFEEGGREGSTRLMILFTDGRLRRKDVKSALDDAKQQGVSVSTVAIGSTVKGSAMMRRLAKGAGGSFVAVSDPKSLPDAFLSLRTTGVQEIVITSNGSSVIPRLAGEKFSASVPLEPGENRILVRGTSIDGRALERSVTVTVRSPGCGELVLRAEHEGKPAISISNRAVELVVDASGSMWGAMDDRTKIQIAKQILNDALEWLPSDLSLSLRAYGHLYDRREQNCEDTELLVAPGTGNRPAIRSAIRRLKPQGQTPLGYSLAQVAADFGDFQGERAVVLVTDGLESCGGDAPAEARALQAGAPLPVHVIGFGLEGKSDDELEGLRAIAEASGGRFLTAGSATELRQALGTTIGTPFTVLRDDEPIARGTLGSDDRVLLPAGEYRVDLESAPPYSMRLQIGNEQKLTVVLQRANEEIAQAATRAPLEYTSCDEPAAPTAP